MFPLRLMLVFHSTPMPRLPRHDRSLTCTRKLALTSPASSSRLPQLGKESRPPRSWRRRVLPATWHSSSPLLRRSHVPRQGAPWFHPSLAVSWIGTRKIRYEYLSFVLILYIDFILTNFFVFLYIGRRRLRSHGRSWCHFCHQYLQLLQEAWIQHYCNGCILP